MDATVTGLGAGIPLQGWAVVISDPDGTWHLSEANGMPTITLSPKLRPLLERYAQALADAGTAVRLLELSVTDITILEPRDEEAQLVAELEAYLRDDSD